RPVRIGSKIQRTKHGTGKQKNIKLNNKTVNQGIAKIGTHFILCGNQKNKIRFFQQCAYRAVTDQEPKCYTNNPGSRKIFRKIREPLLIVIGRCRNKKEHGKRDMPIKNIAEITACFFQMCRKPLLKKRMCIK